jgi:hypothetical protein
MQMLFKNVIEKEANFVLECLFYNSIRDRFPSSFQIVVLGSRLYSMKWPISY